MNDFAKRSEKKKSGSKTTIFILILVLVVLLTLAYFIGRPIVLKQMYPIAYTQEIEVMSKKYELDPYFVSAVIFKESSFRKDAVSHRGAVGLMQLMPDTGEWIAKKLNMETNGLDLADIQINLELGCWYLQYLNNMFQGNTTNVLAGYNAGPNKVKSWQKEYSDDGVNLHTIPYPETEKYVKKVNETYEMYKELYNEVYD